MRQKRKLRIGELAGICGVSTRTIDYYTRLGLLQPATRTDANYRLYEHDAVQLLMQVKHLQLRRLSLQEIRERLEPDTAARDASMLQEVRRDLEAIAQKVAAIRDRHVADGALPAAVEEALGHALRVSEHLRELSGHGGVVPTRYGRDQR